MTWQRCIELYLFINIIYYPIHDYIHQFNTFWKFFGQIQTCTVYIVKQTCKPSLKRGKVTLLKLPMISFNRTSKDNFSTGRVWNTRINDPGWGLWSSWQAESPRSSRHPQAPALLCGADQWPERHVGGGGRVLHVPGLRHQQQRQRGGQFSSTVSHLDLDTLKLWNHLNHYLYALAIEQ